VKSFYRLMLTSLLSIAIASALSIVPMLDRSLKLGGPDAPVFRSDTAAVMLSDRNLVDVLAKVPLAHSIDHVEWSDSILSVDLKAPPGKTEAEAVYDDLYELARVGFTGTKNVKQLLVRVMEQPTEPSRQKQLLLAMDARREDVGELPGTDARIEGTKEQFLSSHFTLTYTHNWLDRHRR